MHAFVTPDVLVQALDVLQRLMARRIPAIYEHLMAQVHAGRRPSVLSPVHQTSTRSCRFSCTSCTVPLFVEAGGVAEHALPGLFLFLHAAQGLELCFFASKWFMTVFTDTFPVDFVVRVRLHCHCLFRPPPTSLSAAHLPGSCFV